MGRKVKWKPVKYGSGEFLILGGLVRVSVSFSMDRGEKFRFMVNDFKSDAFYETKEAAKRAGVEFTRNALLSAISDLESMEDSGE